MLEGQSHEDPGGEPMLYNLNSLKFTPLLYHVGGS